MTTAFEVQFSERAFNALPEIEIASHRAHQGEILQTMKKEIGGLLGRFDLHGYWGACLLHNHWTLTDAEIPVETLEQVGYLSRPISNIKAPSCTPSVLGLRDGQLMAFEYSSVQASRAAYAQLCQRAGFVSELKSVLETNELDLLFGISVLKRPASLDYTLVEETLGDRRSITMDWPQDKPRGELVQTFWAFPESMGGWCKRSCHKFGRDHRPHHYAPDD